MTNKYKKLGVLIAAILMIVGIVVMFNKYNVYQGSVDEANEKKLNQALAYFQVYLDDTIKELEAFSKDGKVIDYYNEVTDEADLETHKYYTYVYENIKHMESTYESVDYAYVSSNHVNSMLSVPDFDTSDYIASDRTWFKTPIKSNLRYTSNFYFDPITQEPNMMFSEVIRSTSVHGVVGIDVNMEPVFDYLIALGDIILLKGEDAFDLKNPVGSSFYFMNSQTLIHNQTTSDNDQKSLSYDYIPEDTTEINYMNKKHNLTSGIEPITGYQIIVLKDAALENKMITSSLVQTFFVFFVLSIIIIILGNRQDNIIRHNQYKEEV